MNKLTTKASMMTAWENHGNAVIIVLGDTCARTGAQDKTILRWNVAAGKSPLNDSPDPDDVNLFVPRDTPAGVYLVSGITEYVDDGDTIDGQEVHYTKWDGAWFELYPLPDYLPSV